MDTVTDSDFEEEDSTKSNLDGDAVFETIYVLNDWETNKEDKRITVAILISSDNFERAGYHDVSVFADSFELEVPVVWL